MNREGKRDRGGGEEIERESRLTNNLSPFYESQSHYEWDEWECVAYLSGLSPFPHSLIFSDNELILKRGDSLVI